MSYYPDVRNVAAERLTEDERDEVLAFLARRPLHSVILAGWIRDHGIVSPQHRGEFYGCRGDNGNLVGVALIGKYVLFEARGDDAIIAFARRARACPDVRMMFAQENELNAFWHYYDGIAPMPRTSRHQLITSVGCDSKDIDFVEELRIATEADLDQVIAAHAEMVFEETGVDPLLADADGFRMRCSRRVEDGRVWVWVKDGELIFKTDVVSVTSAAIYIEGLWVNPKARGRGNSTRGLTTMCRRLLTGSNAMCGFLDEEHAFANSLYRRAGFTAVDTYAKIYL